MTPDAQTALFQAIHANNEDGVGLLIAAEPGLLTARSPSGLSPVLFAAYYVRPRIVRLLLEAGAPLSVHEAAATGQLTALRAHLDTDPALVNGLSPDGFSPLGLAAFFGHEEAAAELLERGADVNRPSENAVQARPLHSAAAGNHTALARRLIAADADVKAPQQDGFTPLMAAAQNGNAELAEALLEAGADPAVRTADGQDAADLAREEGHAALADRLAGSSPRLSPDSPHEPPCPRASRKPEWRIPGARADTGLMTDPRDGRPDEELQRQTPMPVNELTGQPDSRTGFQTHDPKDVHQDLYTSTPSGDRVASADQGKGVSLPPVDPGAVTHQFDHLATRDPEAMAHELEAPEFAGAQTVADVGVDGALLDRTIPAGIDAGVSASLTTQMDRQQGAADPNPGYVPPSQRTVPHVGEQPGDLPTGAPAELRDDVDGRGR